ncbi:hypothetical protein DAMA08_031370 [Martiniozyma asiatica (nom. inval.)]|nr:hypothetical protein DAMA08_031370 [Martiniozyma asiatica]
MILFYFAYKYDSEYLADDIVISDKLHMKQLGDTTTGMLANNGHNELNTSGGLLHRLEGWKPAAIDGAIGVFIIVLVGVNGLYYQACSPTILAAVGVAVPESLPVSISACVVSGIALLLIDSATIGYLFN